MYQVFKGLPEELQWEILTEFVGGFAVRYKKLRRFLSVVLKFQILRHTYEINPTRPPSGYLKNFSERYLPPQFLIPMPYNLDDYHLFSVEAFLIFSHKEILAILLRTISTNQYSHCYYNSTSKQWIITPIDNSVTLPPYEKHYYPPFPNTNKKLGRPIQMMGLFDPLIYKERSLWQFYSQPNGLELGLIVVSGLSLVFRSDMERLLGLDDLGLLGIVGLVLFGAVGLCGYLEREYLFRVRNKPGLCSWLRSGFI